MLFLVVVFGVGVFFWKVEVGRGGFPSEDTLIVVVLTYLGDH